MARPDPYVKKDPGDIMLAADWNELQVQAREEIRAHRHTGDADGQPISRAGIAEKAIDGSRIDPEASVAVQALDVKAELKVRGRAILDEVDRLLASVGLLKSTAEGNVGIGTNTPAGRLNIGETKGTAHNPNSGTLVIDHEDNGGASSIVFRSKVNRGSDYGFIQYQDTAKVGGAGESALLTIGISNDSDDHIALMPSGNMGIGTTAPTHKFHVLANDAVGLFESSGTQAYLRLSTKEGLDNRVEITNRPGGRLSLWTAGGSDVLNITREGNVGIGTITPVTKLDIAQARTNLENHPKAVKGLYVTGDFGADADGVEFRHSNGTQGIGFGYNTIYATGSNASQDLNLKAKNGTVNAIGPVMQRLDLIACGGRGDWNAANHPIMQYFKAKLAGRPVGTYVKAIQDHPSWRGHYWQGWVDADGRIRVIHNNINTPNVVT